MPTSAPKEKTRTFYCPIDRVTVTHIKQMYELYQSYYENTALDIFISDLSKKTGVIMVTRKSDDRLVGFSTQVLMHMTVDGRKVRGIFSGDTIVDKRYWGNNELAKAFYKFCVRQIVVRPPWIPLYWFLISKGYKTYLLMTNNSYKFYPRSGGDPWGNDEFYKHVTESYSQQLFPEYYDKEKGVLDFGHDYVHLKGDVADITPELAASNEHIAYFDQVNPGWRVGHELPCLAALDYHSILLSLWHRPAKWFKRNVLGQKVKGKQVEQKLNAAPPAQRWANDSEDALDAGKAS
ncbi:hypothetical protein EYS42_13115 [Aquabacterium lacunae]|uniref:Uncharacterized protein n=1 Tax=Aquabacterium lacunae TaxID=2528630 RepID=A0A4Q9GYL5_9BURK|nr:hypothetical protein [Aquabacterium lacunae]TBO29343.1 hypothetical protein EYS42_13115 [Aquabacterium lacunae]